MSRECDENRDSTDDYQVNTFLPMMQHSGDTSTKLTDSH